MVKTKKHIFYRCQYFHLSFSKTTQNKWIVYALETLSLLFSILRYKWGYVKLLKVLKKVYYIVF